jgi:hypothetical protein
MNAGNDFNLLFIQIETPTREIFKELLRNGKEEVFNPIKNHKETFLVRDFFLLPLHSKLFPLKKNNYFEMFLNERSF